MAAPNTYFVTGFEQLAGYLRGRGARRIAVLTSPRRRFIGDLETALTTFDIRVFDGAQVHVPLEVVDAAETQLDHADTLLAVGGGAAIGLGKALRVRRPDLHFVALPTTYSGSEMTSMYGVTTGTSKQTGRLAAAQPDAVFYDVNLTRDLPLALTIQSLTNGIAHVISILSTGSIGGAVRHEARAAAATVVRAIEQLLHDPESLPARELAQRGASACGAAFEQGKPGVQHALAHLLGGALRVDHAALHAILLPHFVAHLRATQPAIVTELERVLEPTIYSIYSGAVLDREHDLDCYLHDILTRAGAPVAMTALVPPPSLPTAPVTLVTASVPTGSSAPSANAAPALTAATLIIAVDSALSTRPDLPSSLALDARFGLRPPGRFGRIDLGSEPHALVVGCALADAKSIILALHGRGAEAGTIARRYRDIVEDPHVAVVGLRSEGGLQRWYEVRYGQPGAGSDVEANRAIARVETALSHLQHFGVPILLAGFSQGACLALEVAARTSIRLAAVLAPGGARIGQPDEWKPRTGLELPVLVGAAADDKWIARADLDATIVWYRTAGATMTDLSGPGDKHEITEAQRSRARHLVRGSTPTIPLAD